MFSMSHGKQTLAQGDVSESVFAVMEMAVSTPGQPVPIPSDLAARIQREMTAEASAKVLQIRRRERTTSPDMLALYLG
jgi:hypothetical protein